MSLILKGNTIGGNNVTNLEVKSHGANFFNVNSDELKLNTNIVGNGYAGFNGRFASPIIRVQPGTLYFGFFGGYNARWIDKTVILLVMIVVERGMLH